MNTAGLSPKLVGGAMIGPQNGVVKSELGVLLNGLVNYVAPLAYAQLQVLEQAVRAVDRIDDAALSDYTRQATFETVVGNVKFGASGGWE